MGFIFGEDVREVFEIALAPRVDQTHKETGNGEVTKPTESAMVDETRMNIEFSQDETFE